MTLRLRPAAPADAALIARFVAALAAYEHLSHEVVASEADLAEHLFGPNPRVFCDIAEWQGEPAGFALWYYTYSTFQGRHGIWLEDLFVDPERRGLGIGRALLAGLARRCVAEGLGRFEWSVLDWNEPAIAFYRSHGARLIDDWRRCRLDGEALMALGGQ